MSASGRGFDKYFNDAMVDSKERFSRYMEKFSPQAPLISFDRSGADFDDPATLQRIVDALERIG